MQDQSLRFLVVKAHPHDFTHCAGTCGIHAAQGDSITVVSMTNGVGTHNEKLHDELLKPEAEQDPESSTRVLMITPGSKRSSFVRSARFSG